MSKYYTSTEVAKAVYAHAEAHYEEGGWDVIVECKTINDLEREVEDAQLFTPEKAIAWYASGAVSIWADRQADARNSAF